MKTRRSLDVVLAGEVRGSELSARHEAQAPSVSQEILKRLGFGSVKVKTAPTQGASETSSFSIRDLLLLLYINQDRMGSKNSFFEDDHFKANKWRAAFEIVHSLFDESAAATADALREAEQEEANLARYLEDARRFLDQFNVPTLDELEAQIRQCEADVVAARKQLRERQADERAKLGENSQLAEQRNRLAEDDRRATARIEELRRNSKQLGRLRVQYERELAQWRFLQESHTLVSSLPVSRCPACLQQVELKHDQENCYLCKQELKKAPEEIPVENRVKAAERRIKDLDAYLSDLQGTVVRLEQQRADVMKQVLGIDHILNRIRDSTLLSETRAIVEANEGIRVLEHRLDKVREQIAYRKRAQGEGTVLLTLRERIARLREAQRLAQAMKASPQAVIADLTAWYQALLSDIKFPALTNAYVDPGSYRPVVRGQPYRDLSSKGAISLAVVAWHLAVLEQALRTDSQSKFPRVLLLDSPLNQVGRDATDPAFKDQQIVDGFYAVLARLHKRREEFQLFVCDNRPPIAARDMITVAFTRDPNVGRYGLIDDEHPVVPTEPPPEDEGGEESPDEPGPDLPEDGHDQLH